MLDILVDATKEKNLPSYASILFLYKESRTEIVLNYICFET